MRSTFAELAMVEGLTKTSEEEKDTNTTAADAEGEESAVFVVETMTDKSMHHVVGITGISGRVLPTEDERIVLRSAVRSLLDLAGHRAGPARTEVVLTGLDPRILRCGRQSS
ncbi:hypothetical protein AB0L57_07630 [Nocardia sp. NPDC052254]|uniref:hypothetical protein n=1 Tax=Nocardia sp. NPDC052254 TaxID=3155681 RepID=UPI003449C59E